MKINLLKHKGLKDHTWMFLQGVAKVVDGLVILLTLAFFYSSFEMSVARRRSLSRICGGRKKAEKQADLV